MTDKPKVKCEICGREMSAGMHAHTIKCKRDHGIMDEQKKEEANPEQKEEQKPEEPEEVQKPEEPEQKEEQRPKEVQRPVTVKEVVPKDVPKESGDTKQPLKGKTFLDEFLDEWF